MITVSSLQNTFSRVSARQAADFFNKVQSKPMAQLGFGVMGKRMARTAEMAGFEVYGQELNPEDIFAARKDFVEWDGKSVKARAYPGLDSARNLLRKDIEPIYPKTHDYGQHMFVLEALPEDLNLKIKIMKSVVEKLPRDAVIGINTSSLIIEKIIEGLVKELGEDVVNPKRFVGLHFMKPADRNDVIEAIRTKYTSDETMYFAYSYIKAVGKTPVTGLKDGTGGFGNLEINGLINEESKIVAEGLATREVVDEVFMEVFYGKQYKVQLQKAQETFREEIPKLNFFEDEVERYKEIRKTDKRIGRILRKKTIKPKHKEKLKGLVERKKELLEECKERLGQKELYARIGKIIGDKETGAGTFYAPPEELSEIQQAAKKQLNTVVNYLANIENDEDYYIPFVITPYEIQEPTYHFWNRKPRFDIDDLQTFPEGQVTPSMFDGDLHRGHFFNGSDSLTSGAEPQKYKSPEFKPQAIKRTIRFNDREYIAERLRGAYWGIAYHMLKEGLGTIHDIEVVCKGAFRYNVGAFESAREFADKYGKDYVKRCILLANKNDTLTGIIKADEFFVPTDEALSGIQTYIQDGVAHIVMGRYHIQDLKMFMNSLDPKMINAMMKAIDEANTNSNVDAIIFESQGSNEGKGVFCSGFDLDYARNKIKLKAVPLNDVTKLGQKLMDKIKGSTKPTVAIVDGTAAGGGVELLAACDYRIATTRASFTATPECAIGFYPAWRGTDNLSEIIGKEAALPFIVSSKGLIPGVTISWPSIDDVQGMKLGLYDNSERLTTSDLPEFMAKLVNGEYVGRINGEEQIINIRQKPNRKPQFNKHLTGDDGHANFSADVVRSLKMKEDKDGNVVYKRRWRLFTRFPARLAEVLIMYSDDPKKKEEAVRELIEGGKVRRWLRNKIFGPMTQDQIEAKTARKISRRARLVSNLYIKPQQAIVQSKVALTTLKGVGALLKGTWWTAKNLAIKPASWLTKQALTWGVGLPLRITYDTWHYFTKPAVYELPLAEDSEEAWRQKEFGKTKNEEAIK